MKSVLRIFFGAMRTKPWLVLTCLLVAGLFEIVSIGALLPLVAQIGGSETASSSELDAFVNSVFGFFGLEKTFETIVLVVVLTMIIKAVLSFGALGYVSVAIAKVVSVMRSQLVRQLLAARWSYFAEQ